MMGSFAQGGYSVFDRAEWILWVWSCVCYGRRILEYLISLRPNVSCDDTGLPARGSNWTPVTSPTRNLICGHTT